MEIFFVARFPIGNQNRMHEKAPHSSVFRSHVAIVIPKLCKASLPVLIFQRKINGIKSSLEVFRLFDPNAQKHIVSLKISVRAGSKIAGVV